MLISNKHPAQRLLDYLPISCLHTIKTIELESQKLAKRIERKKEVEQAMQERKQQGDDTLTDDQIETLNQRTYLPYPSMPYWHHSNFSSDDDHEAFLHEFLTNAKECLPKRLLDKVCEVIVFNQVYLLLPFVESELDVSCLHHTLVAVVMPDHLTFNKSNFTIEHA